MRSALIVGINFYDHGNSLFGCVDDARAVKAVLARHGDGSMNFDCRLMTCPGSHERLPRGELKAQIRGLFAAHADVALLYFAGHGHIETTGGYLLATDSNGDDGISLNELTALANASTVKNKIIILDSCHSGIAGNLLNEEQAVLADGLTILTASTKEQYATEEYGRGTFTTLLVDALEGGAANLVGQITPGSVYAHIDRSLSWNEQRPVFKTNVKHFVSLRNVKPLINVENLRRMTALFPTRGHELPLDPSFELEDRGRGAGDPPANPVNVEKFKVLQEYNRHGLLTPIGAESMWHASMNRKSCKLTLLGEHYRGLVSKDRI
jgi:hypothetical protein